MQRSELTKALRRKLKAEESRKRSHVIFWAEMPTPEGPKLRPVAMFSHSAKGQFLKPFVVADTKKRLRLEAPEFTEFVGCSIDGNEVRRLYAERPPQPH